MFTPGQPVIFVGSTRYYTFAEDGESLDGPDLTKGAVYTVSEVHPPGFQPWPGAKTLHWCISIAERQSTTYSATLFRPISKTSTDIVESLKAPAPTVRVREDA